MSEEGKDSGSGGLGANCRQANSGGSPERTLEWTDEHDEYWKYDNQ